MIDTPAWVRDAVFYQIFPDRFAASDRVTKPGHLQAWADPPTTHGFKGGDLLGIAEHLPLLADLGITALYLTPIFSSASNHRYHTYDYLRVDPLLGGDAALRELLDGAHARGMRVILDGVFNHTGRGFWPFHHILENGASSPYLDWFREDRAALEAGLQLLAYPDTGRSGPAPGQAGEGASSLERLGYEAWWGLPALPKLNTDYQPVRDYLLTVAEHWIRFGIDGWRLDVPEEIADPVFWQAFRSRVRAVNPEAYLVGEIWHVAPDWTAGDRFDAVMNYPLAEAILGYAGAHHLDDAVVHSHAEYSQIVRLSGAEMAGRIEFDPGGLRAGVRRRPAQPPRQPRHAPDPDAAERRHGRDPDGLPAPGRPARGTLRLLRRRDRHGRRQRSGQPARLPLGRGGLGPGHARVRPGGHRPAPRPAHPARRRGPDRRYLRRFAGDPALRSLGRAERRARWCPAGAGDRECRRGRRTARPSTRSSSPVGDSTPPWRPGRVRTSPAWVVARSVRTAGSSWSSRHDLEHPVARLIFRGSAREPDGSASDTRVYTRRPVADLPFDPANTELAGRLLRSLDVEGKIHAHSRHSARWGVAM